MWGGTHFFVHINALVVTDHIESSLVQNLPGRPQQCFVRFRPDAPAQRVTSYPSALFFLQTLRATANVVHIMSEWSEADTELLLRSFGWSRYCTDVRCLVRQPGAALWTAASASCEPCDLGSSVFVVTEPASWHALLLSQLVTVCHDNEEDDSADGAAAAKSPFGTCGLLYALCQCISLSEWRVRYPGTPVVCSLSLSTTTLFNYCRFHVPTEMLDDETAALLASHGGTLVKTMREATHVLTRTAAEAAASAAAALEELQASYAAPSSTSSTSSSSSDDFSSTTSSDSVQSVASDSPPMSDEDEDDTRADTSRATPVAHKEPLAPAPTQPVQTVVEPTPASPTATDDGGQYVRVTRAWVRDCVRALRLLPVPPTTSVAEAAKTPQASPPALSTLRQTGALLCAMLPPEDAKPLPFTHFARLAQHYHFSVDFLLDPDTHVVSKMNVLYYFKDLVQILTEPHPSTAAATTRSTAMTKSNHADGEAAKEVWLCRNERRRDRNAVSTHVRLLASQFVYSIARVKEEERAARTAGTQTSAPLTAQTGTNTELVETTPVREATPSPEPVRDVPLDVTEAAQRQQPTAAEASTEGEWRSHLKNVEGKLLKRDSPSEDRLFLTGEDDGESMQPPTSIFTHTPAVPLAPPSAMDATPAPPNNNNNTVSIRHPPLSIFSAPPVTTTAALLPLPASRLSSAASLLAAPSQSSSIFPAPPSPFSPTSPYERLAHAQAIPMSDATARTEENGDTSRARFTQCFIPTAQLTSVEQDAALSFVRSVPFFAKCASNTVEREATGIRCHFATAGGAAYFQSSARLRFRGHTLEIVPVYPDRQHPVNTLPSHTSTADDHDDLKAPPVEPQQRFPEQRNTAPVVNVGAEVAAARVPSPLPRADPLPQAAQVLPPASAQAGEPSSPARPIATSADVSPPGSPERQHQSRTRRRRRSSTPPTSKSGRHHRHRREHSSDRKETSRSRSRKHRDEKSADHRHSKRDSSGAHR